MSQVLLLTKNILSDQSLQERLQNLNHEVWCSAQLVDQVQRFGMPPSLIQQFQAVIFSKTICDQEAGVLVDFFHRHPVAILREVGLLPSMEDQASWKNRGLHGFLLEEEALFDLREKLSQAQASVNQKESTAARIVPFPGGDSSKERNAMNIDLTGKESKLMELLIEAQGELITRKELCEKIWSEGQTPSNMSQLSCMINRIKRKFEAQGVEGKLILTHWGKGYQLSEAFYQQCIGYQQKNYQ
ncbi:winged helix-turn-helix domain-containing protein [Enterococcus sp. AZ072]|uniref:winged helix-turn-helix domain-containing protein n=1 Tax=unclassified Enterococcus TaxID=2608891 RepID=UPI003D2DC940